MDYCIYYLTFALIAFLFNKPITFAVLISCAIVDELSEFWFEHFSKLAQYQDSPNLFYAVLFLLYSAWFIGFDALKLKYSTISIGILCLFSGVMFIDATASPESETFLYTTYPVIITILNIMIIIAGYYDNRRVSFASIGRMLSNLKKNHGTNL